jgi:hypothetical protein
MQAAFAEKIIPYEQADNPSKHFIGLTGQFLDFLAENDRIVQSVLKSDMLLELLEIFSRQIISYTKQKLDEDVEKGRELLVSSDLLATCYSGAMLHMTLWWYKQKNPISKDELLRQMATILNIVGSKVLA